MTYVRASAATGFAPTSFAPRAFEPAAFNPAGFAPTRFDPGAAGFRSAATAPAMLPAARHAPAPLPFPPPQAPLPSAEALVRQARYETLDVELDAERRLFRCRLRPVGRPCFSPELLRDVATMHRSMGGLFAGGRLDPDAPVRYFACSSAIPGIFNLGGDLGLFQRLIEARDLASLTRYGHAAVAASNARSRTT